MKSRAGIYSSRAGAAHVAGLGAGWLCAWSRAQGVPHGLGSQKCMAISQHACRSRGDRECARPRCSCSAPATPPTEHLRAEHLQEFEVFARKRAHTSGTLEADRGGGSDARAVYAHTVVCVLASQVACASNVAAVRTLDHDRRRGATCGRGPGLKSDARSTRTRTRIHASRSVCMYACRIVKNANARLIDTTVYLSSLQRRVSPRPQSAHGT